MTDNKIGLIGIGKMGYGIGLSLINRGCELYVLGNKNREGIDKLLAIKAKEIDNISQMIAECKTIILSLPSSAEVDDVLFGLKGIEEGGNEGGNYDGLIIDTATGDPTLSRMILEKLSFLGFKYVDAPVTRGPKEATEGRLNTILGGEDSTKTKANEIVSMYSEFIIPKQGTGSAHKLKLLNNALSISVVAISAEIFAAADKLNIGLESLRNLVKHGGVNNGLLQSLFKWGLDGNKESLDFSISNAEKDLRYFERLCIEDGYETFIVKSVHQLFKESTDAGLGKLTLPNIINVAR
ncbi:MULTISPECIES: NAD(P)-dependent oxidoreductase [Symbiopectobacterium]|uniref:NAD(P)-dependent oxidoreductase n=1 Tax=Symbiopectobacterium TaxID=801 RepID=UPI001A2ECEFF|nr:MULTISPECIES: NAD(P)-dependent oxidoreductase [Symbiopectobacterium]MBG6248404.1 NAD(P)-dependent oxidoreductase [Candidatus Symbiopectobacterium sp. PLON1]MBT9429858.1 NAD(P)-dependent oxidoreductase [Candidatus Symbiopectobacterium endolongispinus]